MRWNPDTYSHRPKLRRGKAASRLLATLLPEVRPILASIDVGNLGDLHEQRGGNLLYAHSSRAHAAKTHVAKMLSGRVLRRRREGCALGTGQRIGGRRDEDGGSRDVCLGGKLAKLPRVCRDDYRGKRVRAQSVADQIKNGCLLQNGGLDLGRSVSRSGKGDGMQRWVDGGVGWQETVGVLGGVHGEVGDVTCALVSGSVRMGDRPEVVGRGQKREGRRLGEGGDERLEGLSRTDLIGLHRQIHAALDARAEPQGGMGRREKWREQNVQDGPVSPSSGGW
jgi:hypothetical protein